MNAEVSSAGAVVAAGTYTQIMEHVRKCLPKTVREQEALGAAAGVSAQTVGKIRSPVDRFPKPETLEQFLLQLDPPLQFALVVANVPPLPTEPPKVTPSFPPDGWRVHPKDSRWFYREQEVLSKAQLRERYDMPVSEAAA